MPIYVHCGFFYLSEKQENKIAYLSLWHNTIILVLLRALKQSMFCYTKFIKNIIQIKKAAFFLYGC